MARPNPGLEIKVEDIVGKMAFIVSPSICILGVVTKPSSHDPRAEYCLASRGEKLDGTSSSMYRNLCPDRIEKIEAWSAYSDGNDIGSTPVIFMKEGLGGGIYSPNEEAPIDLMLRQHGL